MAAKKLDASAVGFPRFEVPASVEADVFALSSHARAKEALELSVDMDEPGFNVFVLGDVGSGRMTATRAFLESSSARRPVPPDWLYLTDFSEPHQPRPVSVPAGVGRAFRDRMAALVPAIREALVAVFGEEDYAARVRAENQRIREDVSRGMKELQTAAQKSGLTIAQTPAGAVVAALGEDKQPHPLHELDDEARNALGDAPVKLEESLDELNRRAGRLQSEYVEWLRELNRAVAGRAVDAPFAAVRGEYPDHPVLIGWLEEVHTDVLDNIDRFRPDSEGEAPAVEVPERRYAVNVLVDNAGCSCPRVVVEPNPTYENIFGRIEYGQREGFLETDVTMIRAGALHKANGGFLILRADAMARSPAVWRFIKAALRDGQIRIEEIRRSDAVALAGTPKPGPVPMDVKVCIVGDPQWYYAFFSLDAEFRSYFKVKADIDADMEAEPANLAVYAALLRGMAAQNGVADGVTLDDAALQVLLGLASRRAGDRSKLTAEFEQLEEVVAEARRTARKQDGKKPASISRADVMHTMESRRRRNARIEDRVHESIEKGLILLDTVGERVGQINALTVRHLGDHAFGAPARVTARASAGRRGVINIERDVELGGPIQQKAAMVLQGILAGRFARRVPISFNCSITFEQNYGGLEGDSASLAELLAMVSDLAGIPLRQDLAITGSLNQRGQAQPVGGVHHKVEGFYRACVDKGGLTGTQGVVIPFQNEASLVLRDEVTEAVAAGRFHIWSVESIEDAIELFTGTPAGDPGPAGAYAADTVYGRVAIQLDEFDAILNRRQNPGLISV